jgi:hypothetical protein
MTLLCRLFGHGDSLRERDLKGRYQLVCQDCGQAIPILPGQKFKARKVKKVQPRRFREGAKVIGKIG